MFFYLLALFVAVPLVELALLIWVGGRLGLGATIALVVVTGILGASLARSQGLATLARFQARLGAGELPHEDLLDGILILIAGAVLLTPGLITDAAGFLLLVPPARAGIRRWLGARLRRRLVVVGPAGPPRSGTDGPPSGSRAGTGTDVLDAEFTVKSEDRS